MPQNLQGDSKNVPDARPSSGAFTRREVSALGLGAVAMLGGCGTTRPDAEVSLERTTQGASSHPTLAAAIAAAPGTQPFVIRVGRGIWRERVQVDKPFIRLVGEGVDQTTVVNDRYAGLPGPGGRNVGTFDTATITVTAPDFSAANLTIANDFDYPKRAAGSGGAQAVAMAVQASANRTLLDNVRLASYQDTLFLDAGRTLIRNCRVEGCVDFIFGAGRAFLERCAIVSLPRDGHEAAGYIAAPDTDVHQPYGFVFHRCRLLERDGVAPRSVALGRPWRHTRRFPDGSYGDPDNVGAVAYIRCWMDDHIIQEGWASMGYGVRGGGRAVLTPQEARFFEFESTGPGAGPGSPVRRQFTASEVRSCMRDALSG